MPYLDNIWYVCEARAEGAHAEFWAFRLHDTLGLWSVDLSSKYTSRFLLTGYVGLM